jgi:2'-5' RNA ligase
MGYGIIAKKEIEQNKKYGCLMVKMNDEISKIFKDFAEKNISKNNLYKSEKLNYVSGVPKDTHCTILFGMVEEKIDEIKKYLHPIKMEFGKIKKFPSKDKNDPYDCLYVEGYSYDAQKINEKLRDKFEYYNDYPEYKIHITLCYVKKDSCDNLLGQFVIPEEGMGREKEFVLNEFKYSSPMGKKYEFEVNDKIESAYMSTPVYDGSQEKSYSQDSYFNVNIDNLADMIYDEDFAEQIVEILKSKGYKNVTKDNIYSPELKQQVNVIINDILMNRPNRDKSNNLCDYMPEDIDLKHWMGILK